MFRLAVFTTSAQLVGVGVVGVLRFVWSFDFLFPVDTLIPKYDRSKDWILLVCWQKRCFWLMFRIRRFVMLALLADDTPSENIVGEQWKGEFSKLIGSHFCRRRPGAPVLTDTCM